MLFTESVYNGVSLIINKERRGVVKPPQIIGAIELALDEILIELTEEYKKTGVIPSSLEFYVKSQALTFASGLADLPSSKSIAISAAVSGGSGVDVAAVITVADEASLPLFGEEVKFASGIGLVSSLDTGDPFTFDVLPPLGLNWTDLGIPAENDTMDYLSASDYMDIGSMVLDETILIDVVNNDMEWADRASSVLVPPTDDYPVARIIADKAQIAPATITTGVILNYISRPDSWMNLTLTTDADGRGKSVTGGTDNVKFKKKLIPIAVKKAIVYVENMLFSRANEAE